MVATRRGTRVGSPVKSTSDENPEVTQPTPSTRRTRCRTLIDENQSQSDSQPDEPKDDSTASSLAASPPKQNTRRSTRLHANKKQPDFTHEADVSESESCCSVASDVPVTPRTRRRTVVREKRVVQDEASEAESCSSAVSATRSRRAPRSLRKRVLTSAASKDDDAKDVDDEDPSGAESCSSAVSFTKGKDTQRLTRSQRKATEADQSEPDSCSSSVSGLRGSVLRRSTRNQKVKVTEPIPLSLEETTDIPSSPVSWNLRGRRRKTEDDEYESDGCKSGPSTSPWRTIRCQAKVDTVVVESDPESVATDICTSHGSPSPQRGKGTPCSSRTGSASSNRAVPVTRTRSRAKMAIEVTTATNMPEEQKGEELDRDKAEDMVEQLDSTITMDTSEAQDCTIIEEGPEETTVLFDQDEPVEPQSSTQDVEAVEDCGSETPKLQEQPVTETIATLPEDKQPDDVAMENEPDLEETSHVVEDRTCSEPIVEPSPVDPVPDVVEKAVEDETCPEPVMEGTVKPIEEDPVPTVVDKIVVDQACSEPVKEDLVEATPEDPEPAVFEEKVECEKKGVIVIEEANDIINTTENDSVTLNNLEGPSTSSHTQVDLSSTEETYEEPSSKKEMITLLDSSEDEDSADEGLSSGEEGGAQEAEDDGMSPDENQMSEEAEAHGKGLFVIDTRPGLQPKEQYYVDNKQTEEEDEEDFVDEEDDDDDEDSKVLFAPKKAQMQLSSSIDTGLKMKELGGLYISFDGNKPKSLSNSMKIQKDPDHPDEVLKKSVIVPDFEKKDAVPPYKESKQAAKLKRKAEREKTTGDGWFNMRAPEVTEELKNDLKALKMRSAMDPKRFYKKNDREGFPKYFQVGTVVDSPVDFYNSRIPKKQRKRTIVEELLADAEFRSSNKRKYQEIMAEKAAQAAGKQHKKKHKFHKKKMNK